MRVNVVGAGLAGCEAACRLAKEGFEVHLFEMRPKKFTPAHKTSGFAELVCSNSLKSEDVNTPQGVLKAEMRVLDSIILRSAGRCRVPAGGALAVDREIFSRLVEEEVEKYENITVIREEVTEIEDNTVIAAGPLISDKLCAELVKITDGENLAFYDAAAPIVTAESVDKAKSFVAGRYGKGGDDYINCPMSREEYDEFVENLVKAERVVLRDFEKRDVFSACMPVEIMAERGADSLRFGPLRPVGLTDPVTGKRPYAVVQLRKEDAEGKMLNIVGFQTNLKFGEQQRVFSLIPALNNAEFVRFGVMHRNTYLNAPKVLNAGFELKNRPSVFVAGQLSGAEGYMESAMTGMIAAINLSRRLKGKEYFLPPDTTATGGLMKYLSEENRDFQPMHVGFPLMRSLETQIRDKQKRKEAYSERAVRDFTDYADKNL